MKLDQTAAPEFQKFEVCVTKYCPHSILELSSKQGLPLQFKNPPFISKTLNHPSPFLKQGGASYVSMNYEDKLLIRDHQKVRWQTLVY